MTPSPNDPTPQHSTPLTVGPAGLPPIPPRIARRWRARWDAQQQRYLPRRTERFEVITDALTLDIKRPDPLIVDLGVGPGSLALHLLDRIPGARIIGVDADPFLLGLADAAREEAGLAPDRLRLVQADLRAPDVLDRLELPEPVHAWVSTTALHWMQHPDLQRLLRSLGAYTAPGGLVLDGDHIYHESKQALFDAFTIRLAGLDAERCGVHENEDWQQWWEAVAEVPEFAAHLAARAGVLEDRHGEHGPARLHHYEQALREAGFADVGTIWQYGDDRVLAARRFGAAPSAPGSRG